jgi:branched-chain amino acid aminotransferase
MNEHFFIYNNQFFRTDVPVITSQNRSFRYGDGLFETMQMHEKKILHLDFHFDRLLAGMKLLEMHLPVFFTATYFTDTVNKLLAKNFILQNARIRLTVFRGEEPIYNTENNQANFIIETFSLPEKIALNEKGLVIDLFEDGLKSCDQFSNIKSNNYLTSLMALRFASKNNLDEAIVLNSFQRVCESSIANIFIVKNNVLFTPPLSEGCVAGVMRRWMLENLSKRSITVKETELSPQDLLSADELFLTNSIRPVRWVQQFRDKIYRNETAKEIFNFFLENL